MLLSTRKIRRKIRTIGNIKKITRAMEMVSAAKLKRVQARLFAIRVFLARLQTILDHTQAALRLSEETLPLLYQTPVTEEARVIGLVVIASNKGLCGAYNINLLRTADQFIRENSKARIKIVTVGKKAYDYFIKQGCPIIQSYPQLPPQVDPQIAQAILHDFIQSYQKRELTEVWVIYTEFVNPMVYKPRVRRLVPIYASYPIEGEDRKLSTPPYGYLFEPAPRVILAHFLPRYLGLTFYRLLLEALSSEHSARMMAMRNATENAEEVIKHLTLSFNKARQAAITKELLDIVGGAEAMK